jgi:hypothetical protein
MFGKKLLISCASFGFFATGLFAKQVEMSKESQLQSLLPNSSGSVTLKNYVQDDNPHWEGRLNLSSTFFDDKLNLGVVFGTRKDNSSTVLKDRGTRLTAELEAYSNDYWAVSPYSQVWFEGDKGNAVLIGVMNNVSWDTEITAGTLEFSLGHDFSMRLGSKEKSVNVTSDGKVVLATTMNTTEQKRFGLTANSEGTLSAPETSPSLAQSVEANASLAIAAVPGMSVSLGGEYNQDFVPKMNLDKTSNKVETPRGGFLNLPEYSISNKSYAVAKAKYDWTDNLYVSVSGYLATKAVDGKRSLRVISSLGMDLF